MPLRIGRKKAVTPNSDDGTVTSGAAAVKRSMSLPKLSVRDLFDFGFSQWSFPSKLLVIGFFVGFAILGYAFVATLPNPLMIMAIGGGIMAATAIAWSLLT